MTTHDEARALQERLRKMPRCGPWQEDGTMAPMLVNPDGPEAADLIDLLLGELERKDAALRGVREHFDGTLRDKDWMETERLVRAALIPQPGKDTAHD